MFATKNDIQNKLEYSLSLYNIINTTPKFESIKRKVDCIFTAKLLSAKEIMNEVAQKEIPLPFRLNRFYLNLYCCRAKLYVGQ